MAIADVSTTPISDLMSLSGRVAVVTGGGGGIGAAICNRLAEAGAAVAVLDLSLDAAKETAAGIADRHGVPTTALAVDVTDEAAVQAAVRQVAGELGDVHVWVNNAGAYPSAQAIDLSAEGWDSLMGLNLRASFVGSREAARHMIDAGHGGAIVNIASTAANKSGGGNAVHYVASKHGVAGMTKQLAYEWGAHGIRVLGVAPTLTLKTPGIEEKQEWLESVGYGSVLDEYASSLPLGRAALPDDVARLVLFAASDMAMIMSGSMLYADAGDMTK